MNNSETSHHEAASQAGCEIVLFVTGESPRSKRARVHLERTIRDQSGHVKNFEVIDVLIEPTKMLDFGIFATPALMVRPCAGEACYMFGDLSDVAKLRELLSFCEE